MYDGQHASTQAVNPLSIIRTAIDEPMSSNPVEPAPGEASLGALAAVFMGDQGSAQRILDHADEAIYQIKQQGGSQAPFYDAHASSVTVLKNLYADAMAHDIKTASHSIEMQQYVRILGERLQKMENCPAELSNEAVDLMVQATPLHDIGKTRIPLSILCKAGSLTPHERKIMMTHTTIGEEILSLALKHNAKLDKLLDAAILIAGGHHEWWDGTGYPRGLSGAQIPLLGRIVAVADVYDALVNARIYKKRWSCEQAVQEIIDNKGTHFDPHVVDAFMLTANDFEVITKASLTR